MTQFKKYLVTGGYGFIGSCLVRRLLDNENYQVANIDKLTYASNLRAVDNERAGYIHLEKDINDVQFLDKFINEYNPDCLIHLAAESHVDRSIDSPGEFINTNIVGTYNLLTVCYKYWSNLNDKLKKKFKFIHVSTDEVYGDAYGEDIFTEKSPYLPNSPYAASKASSDLLVRSWGMTYNFPVIITNSSNNYGKWQFPEKLIPLTIKKILLEEDIPVYGDGSQIRDWLNVSDHIDALLVILNHGKIGETYNISSGIETKNIQLIELICKKLNDINKSKNINNYLDLISFVTDRPGHDRRYAVDNSKLLEELGWAPKINLDNGIEDTIDWYLKNKDWLLNNKELDYDGSRLGLIKK